MCALFSPERLRPGAVKGLSYNKPGQLLDFNVPSTVQGHFRRRQRRT